MKDYNGFPNYNQWNQNLWIANDEGLYLTAKACVETTKPGSLKRAAQVFIDFMKAAIQNAIQAADDCGRSDLVEALNQVLGQV